MLFLLLSPCLAKAKHDRDEPTTVIMTPQHRQSRVAVPLAAAVVAAAAAIAASVRMRTPSAGLKKQAVELHKQLVLYFCIVLVHYTQVAAQT